MNINEKNSETHYDYDEAFSRNIGLLSKLEQSILKYKKVAIAGLGGVGGIHLLSLARTGIGNFHIADHDIFELANFNRQVGANISSLHQPKSAVLCQMAKDINPNINIKIFEKGVTEERIDEFLENVDLFIDGFDFFVLDIRMKVFQRCYELGIPAITAAPIGFSVAYLISLPEKMSFEEYFNFQSLRDEDRSIMFFIKLNPYGQQLSYISDPRILSFAKHRVTSNISSCELCAGVATIEAIKILLDRGKISCLPFTNVYDPYLNMYKSKKIGHLTSLFLKFKFYLAKKILNSNKDYRDISQESTVNSKFNDIINIIELSRYAPSRDNAQPWKFKIISESKFEIIIRNNMNFYEKIPIGTLYSTGALLKNIELVSSKLGYTIEYSYSQFDDEYIFNVELIKSENEAINSDLVDFIRHRTTNRKPHKNKPIKQANKQKLEDILSKYDLQILWIDDKKSIKKYIKSSLKTQKIEMSSYDAFLHNKKTMSFIDDDSSDKIPFTTLNSDIFSRFVMKFLLKKWSIYKFFNKIIGNAILFELEYLPQLHTGQHYIITSKKCLNYKDPNFVDKCLNIGKAVQHFWLEMTKMNLVMQPNFVPILFYYYSKHDISFVENSIENKDINYLLNTLNELCNESFPVFSGRIGFPKSSKISNRSLRKPLSDLILNFDSEDKNL